MLRLRLLLALGAALSAGAAAAQPVSGPYVSLGAGANFEMDQPTHPDTSGFNAFKVDYQFNPGPAGVAGIGWGFGNGIRIEATGDFFNNHVSGARSPYTLRAGGYENQYGAFAAAYYDFNLGLPVTPYIGAGIGYQLVEDDNLNFSTPGYPLPYSSNRSQETHGALAWQGIAGVAYRLPFWPSVKLTAEYRYTGLDDTPGYANYGYHYGVGGKFYNELRSTQNHTALLGVRWEFGNAIALPAESAATENYGSAPPPVSPPVTAPRTYLVFFDWDRADLTPRARQIVSAAATSAQQQAVTRIEVSGFTDLSGTKVYNQALSQRRAEAVATELIRDGVGEDAIDIHGYGEANPLVPTRPGVREPQNRRVEIVLK